MNKTYLPPQESIERNWYIVDASQQRLGRLASEVATVCEGKTSLPSHRTSIPVILSSLLTPRKLK